MAKTVKKKTKKKEVKVVDPYEIVTPKEPKVEKIKVTEVPLGPTTAELKLEIAALRTAVTARIDKIVSNISKAKSVKGL